MSRLTARLHPVRGLAVLAGAIAVGLGSSSGGEPPTQRFARAALDPTPATSANWAGYAVTGSTVDPATGTSTPTSFTSVTATWTQPAATCEQGAAGYSAVWVGLGGYWPESQALEQIGTSADCTSSGTPVYYAWYELVPQPVVPIGLKIVPGDTITTSVNVHGTSVLVQVKNRTRRTSFTRELFLAQPDLSSAEWVAEAPSRCSRLGCRVLPLADFGTVTFSRIAATGDGHAGTLTDPAWTTSPIRLVPRAQDPVLPGSSFAGEAPASPAGADPGPPTPDGRSFSVAWNPSPEPPASG